MADKNFARSGTGDAGLLADDDPLSELARLVNLEPRPVQSVGRSFAEPEQATPRRDNPVLALEDELMRAFEQYDAPGHVEDVVPVEVERAALSHEVEPVVEIPVEAVNEAASFLDEAPTRDAIVDEPRRYEPVFESEPSFEEPEMLAGHAEDFAPSIDADPALSLADELEFSMEEAPVVAPEAAADVEPEEHSGLRFVDRFEPRFEEPVRQEPSIEAASDLGASAYEPQPAFLGLQPVEADEQVGDDFGLDLERELELSIGHGLADDLVNEETVLEEGPVASPEPAPVTETSIEIGDETRFDEWVSVAADSGDAGPFDMEPVYAKDEPHFVGDLPHETREERARAAAEIEAKWQMEAADPVFSAEPDYRVQSVSAGQDYDHDDLLAEVERYPVPEARSPLPLATEAEIAETPRNTIAHSSAIFSRATPVANRDLGASTARSEPVLDQRQDTFVAPASVAASEPDVDFENMEFDLSDIDLDLSDLSLDEEQPQAREAEVKPVETRVESRTEPVVAVPVSAYTVAKPAVSEMADGTLPFDPTMIAETDVGVAPVSELDVPQLPVIEKEKPPVYQPDYDLDIDAEMAQLFNEPTAKQTRTETHQGGVATASVTAAASQPVTQINDVDDFERALEEDFRRSLNQPERMAIPVDPGQANTLYGGDGYDEEQARPRRGMLVAASIAGLLLIGGGGVYAWSSFTGESATSGEPRVILADKDPIKIVPEEKGGKTVPNQDKAVYDRVAGDKVTTPQQEQLVTSTEEPIDVVQRTLTPETLPFDGPEDDTEASADDENRLLPGVDEPETATADAGNKPLVSPRKVKTMIVKPDGTLVAREDVVSEPATETAQLDAKATATTGSASGEAVATANATIDTDASLRAEQVATDGQPRSVLAEVANAEVEDTAPVRTVKTTTIGGTTTDDKAPVPETRPIDQPVTVVGTVTENGNVSGNETASATQTQQTIEQTQIAPGSYVIQIASLPSEAEAQKSYKNLSSKFASVIGGRGVDIKKAEIPNKGTYFRVRIPAGSREEANALCSRYKSAGGNCLVTR